MLRDFVYHADHDLIYTALSRFQIQLPKLIAVTRFEVISPDSFMWRLSFGSADGGKIYYLYAEDYVPSLTYIVKTFAAYTGRDDLTLVRAADPVKFEDSAPAVMAEVAAPPPRDDNFMRYRIGSGIDHVFLAASPEEPRNAMFSEDAPRGFRSAS